MKKETFTILQLLQKTCRWAMASALVLLLFAQDGLAQCPLACNNLVQVSVDENCKAVITADMILEDPGPGCTYVVVVYGINGQPIPGATVTSAHIGQTLTVSVFLGSNSCWGAIFVEDKLPPVIECPRLDTVFCNQHNYALIPPVVTDNCSGVTRHVISDEILKYPCDSVFAGKRVIKYYYTDASGNRSDTCEQCVYFEKIDPVTDVDWPLDTIFDCEDMDTVPSPAVTGVPKVAGEPLYPSWGICQIAITYEDQILPICPKSFKVLRKWTYLDWCRSSSSSAPPNPYYKYQVIKVIDTSGPVLSCSPNITINTDVWKCTGTALLPSPTILQECSYVDSIYVGYKVVTTANDTLTYDGTNSNNIVKLKNGLYSISELPLGLNWVVFRVWDACGNYTECATEVYVEDKVPPVAVCDQKTTVTLTLDGTAKVAAITFDDGSHDNCGISRYEARRMDNGKPCNTPDGDEFNPYVFFCCDDIGKTLVVSMRVWDIHGNSNTCMVEIEVQDKLAPYIICPPHITVSCEFDYTDLSVFGTVRDDAADREPIVISDKFLNASGPLIDGYAYDGCGVDIDESVFTNLKCGEGTIRRTFIATDDTGNSASCTQIITIEDYITDNVEVFFPLDTVFTTVCLSKQQLTPEITGKPVIKGADKCSNVVTTYEDLVFTLDPGACIKILRKWIVIDWCVWKPNEHESPGYWSWTQVIKVVNNVPPKFTSSCSDRTVDVFGPGCKGQVDLVASADDDCTDDADLSWTHTVDLFNDGTNDASHSGPGRDASGVYPVGVHKVQFTVYDACNNKNTCTFLLTVRDGKKPTPVCLGSVVTTVMPSSKSVAIWAKDFDLKSEDNCTPHDSLRFAFLINGRFEPSMVLTCSNIGINILRVYVIDKAGNSDYCEVQLDLQDPNKVCPTGLTITGKFTTIKGGPVAGVTAIWERANPAGTNATYSDKTGAFAFNNITPGMDYTLRAEKTNGQYVNGVSTYDIVLIQKHILGIQLFDSPYKFLAADVNASCGITAADIAEIRKLILGTISKFDKTPSWNFIPVASAMPNPVQPCGFVNSITYNLINRNETSADFYGIKMGDINIDVDAGNFSQTSTRNANKRLFVADEVILEAGREYDIPVYFGQDAHLEGLQLAVQAVGSRAEILGLKPGKLPVSEDEYVLDGSQIRMAVALAGEHRLGAGETAWYLRIRATASGRLSQALQLSQALAAECYEVQYGPVSLDFAVRDAQKNDLGRSSVLYQNVPNPFTGSTRVGFEIERDQEVEFVASELNGKVLFRTKKFYAKGYHEFDLSADLLPGEGVFFLQMNAHDFSETKRLIHIR